MVVMDHGRPYEARFPRTALGATFARLVLRDSFARWLDDDALFEFHVAVGEALANGIEHGDGDHFTVRTGFEGPRLFVEITQDGAGRAPRPFDPARGYGLNLIRQFTDRFEMRDRGRSVRLVKRLSQTAEETERAV